MPDNIKTSIASFAEAISDLGGSETLGGTREGRAKYNALNGLANLALSIKELHKKVDELHSDVKRVKRSLP